MTAADIAAREPYSLTAGDTRKPVEGTRARMAEHGQWHKGQNAGRRWSIGCVSLEITQRCNLDCTLCYLSEASEAVKDIPMEEIFRRIDMIHEHYGPGTDVQISGGDPTLRKLHELEDIVKYIIKHDMRCSLFTNGILATNEMLTALAAVGLTDVAFHVDLTQERKGYPTEVSLNEVRAEYIERARGTGLGVFFNTTVYDQNFKEIPEVVEFFVEHADDLNLCSFQLQADTGRGVLRERDFMITQQTVADQIRAGSGVDLNFDGSDAGHKECNRYALGLVANGTMYDALDSPDWINDMLERSTMLPMAFDRAERKKGIAKAMVQFAANPKFIASSAKVLGGKALEMRKGLVRSRGKFTSLAFFIHNFMDACELSCERIDSCVFMVATGDGPMSMCLHNAKRDEYLLKPVELQGKQLPNGDHVVKFWNPLTGQTNDDNRKIEAVDLTSKTARGRAKTRLDEKLAGGKRSGVTVKGELAKVKLDDKSAAKEVA